MSPDAILKLGVGQQSPTHKKTLKSMAVSWETVIYYSLINVLYVFHVECSNTFNEGSY